SSASSEASGVRIEGASETASAAGTCRARLHHSREDLEGVMAAPGASAAWDADVARVTWLTQRNCIHGENCLGGMVGCGHRSGLFESPNATSTIAATLLIGGPHETRCTLRARRNIHLLFGR